MKIYKIIDNTNGNVYIGKTKNTLNYRLRKHKSLKDCSSRKIIENGDYRIELIEETEDDSRERYWVLNTECINKNIPGRTYKEYYEDNKEQIDEWRRQYREKTKDKRKEYQKELYKYKLTWGGLHNDNNLLKIHPDLFL
tara:strand:- start:892 stop:1308 length:417 start_codon:yes stop_codon:yes gene_type:complete